MHLTRLGAIVAALSLSAGAQPAPKCEKPSSKINAEVSSAAEANQKSLEAALAKKGWKRVSLPKTTDQGEKLSPKPAWTVVTRGGGRYVAGQPYSIEPWGGSIFPSDPNTLGFVQDKDGVYFWVDGKPRVLSSVNHLLCGCGPVGGGAAPPPPVPAQDFFQLPEKAKFAGRVTLEWDVHEVTSSYNDQLPSGEMCPQPP